MKRSLFKDIGMGQKTDLSCFDADISKVKKLVDEKIQKDSSAIERKAGIMMFKRKVAVGIICAVFILGITVWAANGVINTWYSSSSSVPEYNSLPSQKQVYEDIGYNVTLIEEFENGYKFESGSVVNNKLTGDGNAVIESFKSVYFRYFKNGDRVNYSQEKFNSEAVLSGSVAANEEGIDIYYFTYMNKFVPADYELTEEDKQAEASGELVFSYGSDKVEIKKIQSVAFKKDGVRHGLMQIDGSLSEDELVEMAREIIKNN